MPEQVVKAVHRLDRDTSGCQIFTLSSDAWEAMVELLRAREVEKIYHAIVIGAVKENAFSIQKRLDGKEAISRVKALKHLGPRKSSAQLTLVEVEIETGRTHQIRKHLHSIHFPILGDKQYFSKNSQRLEFRNAERQMLHAYEISFIHPQTDKRITVTAPYPSDFKSCIA